MQWLIAVTMGLWAVWTWSQQREQERLTERARLAALYVNPFMSACEDLQSRIYNILELRGLRTLRKRYPDGAYAEEVLYLIVRYFGWAAALSRYSPYSQDPVVTRLAEAVRDAFATTDAEFPVGPFTRSAQPCRSVVLWLAYVRCQPGGEENLAEKHTSPALRENGAVTKFSCVRSWL